eukprot:m.111179 g.111179  ORF g.111179 m.111179 type:complete len:416 (+) comp10744_c0_seq1:2783-4030(+)
MTRQSFHERAVKVINGFRELGRVHFLLVLSPRRNRVHSNATVALILLRPPPPFCEIGQVVTVDLVHGGQELPIGGITARFGRHRDRANVVQEKHAIVGRCLKTLPFSCGGVHAIPLLVPCLPAWVTRQSDLEHLRSRVKVVLPSTSTLRRALQVGLFIHQTLLLGCQRGEKGLLPLVDLLRVKTSLSHPDLRCVMCKRACEHIMHQHQLRFAMRQSHTQSTNPPRSLSQLPTHHCFSGKRSILRLPSTCFCINECVQMGKNVGGFGIVLLFLLRQIACVGSVVNKGSHAAPLLCQGCGSSSEILWCVNKVGKPFHTRWHSGWYVSIRQYLIRRWKRSLHTVEDPFMDAILKVCLLRPNLACCRQPLRLLKRNLLFKCSKRRLVLLKGRPRRVRCRLILGQVGLVFVSVNVDHIFG